ncbi:MAG: hypothetical protein AB1600_08425 [Bacteroidota bacterium]
MQTINRSGISRVLLTTLLFLLLPFSYRCIKSPLEPKPPSWTTQLTIPLIDRTYYFSDLIAKDSAFTTEGGTLVYKPASLNNEPTPISIPNLDPVEASFTRQLGLIPLTSVTIPGISLSFQDLTGQSPPSFPWPGPELSTSQNRELISDTASYDYLVYEEAVMTLSITNTFNFDVTFAPGGIQLVDTTVSPEEVIGVFSIGQVAKNGGSVTASISLNGKRLSSVLRMRFQFQTVDLTGKTINSGGSISSVISITKNGTAGTEPTLSEAKMKLANEFYVPVTNIRDSVQKLSDSIFIKNAEFSGGEFNIVINNGIPFDVIVEFNLRELVHKQTNQSFKLRDPITDIPSDSITIRGKQGYDKPYELKNYKLEARRQSGGTDTLTSGLHFSLSIKTLVRSNVKQVIKKTDSVLVQILPKKIAGVTQPYVIDNVRGKIPPTRVNITEEVPAGIGTSTDKFTADSIKLEGAKIVLKIFTNSLFPTDLKFAVQGVLNGVPGNSLATPPGNRPATNDPDPTSYRIFPGDTAKIIFDDAHPDPNGVTLSKFLSSFVQGGKFKFPEKFIVQGTAVLEPRDAYANDSVGYVKNNDSVYTSLDFSFPLKVGIMNGSYKDTASFTGNIEDTSQINSIVGGRVFFDLHSTFPIGLEVQSKLLKPSTADSTKPSKIDPPVLILDTIRVAGDDSPNRVGKKSFTFVSLTVDEAAKISQAAFTAIDIKLASAVNGGSTPVAFRPNDSITVRTSANIKFNVDFDRLGGKK